MRLLLEGSIGHMEIQLLRRRVTLLGALSDGGTDVLREAGRQGGKVRMAGRVAGQGPFLISSFLGVPALEAGREGKGRDGEGGC
jgi:hypothetical protein